MENQDPTKLEMKPEKNWFLRHEVLYTILGILLLVLIAGSYFWWQLEKDFRTSECPLVNNQPDCSGQLLKTNEASNWKTYRSTEYGFELKHPSGWVVEEASPYKTSTRVISFEAKTEDQDWVKTNGPTAPVFQVEVYTARQYEDEMEKCRQARENHSEPSDCLRSLSILSQNSNYTFVYLSPAGAGIWVSPEDFTNDLYKVGETSSKTFKFIELIPADWRTYRNEEYGFEIKIPSWWIFKKDSPQSVVFYSDDATIEKGINNCLENGDTSECLYLWNMHFYYYNSSGNFKSENVERINNQDFYVESHDFVTIYKIYKGSTAYGFSISHKMDFDDEVEGKLSQLKQILSTFRFTDQSSEDLFSAVKPLYQFSEGNPTWSEPEYYQGDYFNYNELHVDKTPEQYVLKGEKITGTATIKNTQWIAFQDYYNKRLISAGWEQDSNLGADGPNGSVWGYRKGSQVIKFEWSGAPTGQGWNTFSIISGEVLPLTY